MLSVVDDPTAARSGATSVIGGYKVDDEGVAAAAVEVIKDGALTALLTARTVPTGRRTAPTATRGGSRPAARSTAPRPT
jgi:predicted Zn-dependent protease